MQGTGESVPPPLSSARLNRGRRSRAERGPGCLTRRQEAGQPRIRPAREEPRERQSDRYGAGKEGSREVREAPFAVMRIRNCIGPGRPGGNGRVSRRRSERRHADTRGRSLMCVRRTCAVGVSGGAVRSRVQKGCGEALLTPCPVIVIVAVRSDVQTRQDQDREDVQDRGGKQSGAAIPTPTHQACRSSCNPHRPPAHARGPPPGKLYKEQRSAGGRLLRALRIPMEFGSVAE